jgi:hypothetical protein
MVGDHQSVNRRLGIWLSPDRWALVSFLYLKKRRKGGEERGGEDW